MRPASSLALDSERLFEGFENLMPFRVQDILLVSSLYDSFILREDGRLSTDQLDRGLTLHATRVVLGIFLWREGRFHFNDGGPSLLGLGFTDELSAIPRTLGNEGRAVVRADRFDFGHLTQAL